MKVLVSAFTPFNKAINNYSLEVLNYLENVDKIVVDVIYDKCYQELENKFNLDDYDLIIALGEARSRKVLTLETKAYNLASCSLPDNANILRKDSKIIEDGQNVLQTQINISELSNIVELSTDPERFVCNNMYYHLLHNYPSKSLFVHIPHCNDDENEYIKYAIQIESIIKAIEDLWS